MKSSARWQTWWRKRNRLDHGLYQGPAAFSVTVATRQRQTAFVDAAEVQRFREMLEGAARDTGFRLLAYCFMPDHLHLLVEGSEGTDLARFMKAFKQDTSFDYERRVGSALWQRSYYDTCCEDPMSCSPRWSTSSAIRSAQDWWRTHALTRSRVASC